MRIFVLGAGATGSLLAQHLERQGHTVTRAVGPGEIAVSLLGSLNEDAMRMQLYLLVRAWEAAANATAEIVA